MAASGSTPISLYYSPTASAVPVNTNLVNGELALNTTDEKLYFKNAAGTVKLLASNAGSNPVTTFSGGTTGLTPSTGTSGAVTLAGTLAVANGGTGVTTSTGSGSAVLSVSPTLTGTTSVAALRLTGATSGYVGLSPAAVAGSTTYTLPAADGTAGQVLQTSGAAVLSWVSTSGLTNFTSGVNTTAPNATVPYVSLTATNAATNVDVAIVPKGTGGFSLAVADNTTTGGNKRGAGAVDLQVSRNAATQVASGNSSFAAGLWNTASGAGSAAVGGLSNTCTGTYGVTVGGTSITNSGSYAGTLGGQGNNNSGNLSAIISGANNTAAQNYNVIIGGAYGNTTNLYTGVVVLPAVGVSGGLRQFCVASLYADTTTTASTALTTDGSTFTLICPANSTYYFKGTVIAGVTGAGDTKGWVIEGVVKRGGSFAAFVGTPTVTSSFADAGASTWAVSLTTGISAGMTINVTGAAGVTIRWVANVQMTMMGF